LQRLVLARGVSRIVVPASTVPVTGVALVFVVFVDAEPVSQTATPLW
jgi:hypothetical protein